MSSLIARIIVRSPSNHSRAVHAAACPASHPRLSFADLDRLLEQEERMLAPQQTNHTAGHEDTIDEEGLNESWDVEVVEHADEETDQTEDKRKGSRTETHGEGEQDTRKGSRTETQHDVDGDGGEEQTRKASRDGEKADRKDLLELKESALDDLRTISAAEEHLMKDKSSIIYEWASEEQVERMKKLLEINCLHKGDLEKVEGKRWMIAIDGSEASRRAWQGVIKLLGPLDHLLVVTVRDKNLPKSLSINKNEAIQLRFELWMSARHIVKPFMEELAKIREPSRYSVMIAEAWDARRLICNLAKRYGIDVICLGEHTKGEHKFNHWHLRSLPTYICKNAPCRVLIY